MVASLGATPLHVSLSIYDLSLPRDDMGICTFLLPQVRDQTSMLTTEVHISGDQSCLWAPHSSLKVPFFTSHKNKILGITYSYDGETSVSFILFMPISTIFKHVHAIQTGEEDCNLIPWDEWGICGARFLDIGYNPSPTWVRCAYGQQYVISDTRSRGYETVRVYDFNPLSLKYGLVSMEDKGDHSDVLAHTTRIEAEPFAFPVLSSLPCQVRAVQLSPRNDGPFPFYTDVMMTEDALVAVTVSRYIYEIPFLIELDIQRTGTQFHVFNF
jgi:hypothetical protein